MGATMLYVDGSNSACSDSGLGTPTQPFCTIHGAAAKVSAGQTVQVAAGTYQEVVNIPTSGTAAAPIVFTAAPGATVTLPNQTNGFVIANRSWITVTGFTVTRTSDVGINVQDSSNITISNNHVSYSGLQLSGYQRAGIRLGNTRDSLVVGNTADHNSYAGITLTTGSTRDEVRANFTFNNAQGFARAAPGIRIYQAVGNVVDRNITHDNEDSGIEVYPGANDTLVYDNVSYNNGDHGIDDVTVSGVRILSNTIYHNVTAGINYEGSSSNGTIANNICVDNGIGSPRTHSDIRVEHGSTTGTTVDYNQVYLTTPDVLLVWNSVNYSSIAAYQAATGQMLNGVQADPRWANVGAGDFHLTAGSPAIDSANSGSSGQPPADVEGTVRVDDPATSNTGAGPRTYDDRGAYEFQPSGDLPPSVALAVSPSSGVFPLAVTADASGSSDTDATPIASYSFSFGDGSAVVGPQAGATATHTYTAAGTYTVTATATDTGGQSSSTTRTVTVNDLPPNATLTVNPTSGTLPLPVTADASGSTDPDPTPIASYSFDFGDGSPVIGPQATATASHTYAGAGIYTVTVTVKDTAGQSSTATAQVTVNAGAGDAPPVAALALNPTSGTAPLAVSANASGSTDTDQTPIASYRFDFGDGSPAVGPQAGATATHTYATAGTYTVTVTVKDTAGQSSTATAQVTVSPTLVSNPSFETDLSGWNTSGSDPNVTIARVAGGHTGNWSAKLTNTGTVAASCLLNDAPNWVTSTSAGSYLVNLWARADTAGAALTLRIREYAGSSLVRTTSAQIALSTAWQQLSLTHTTASPGSSLDFSAYVTKAAPGTCFYADDIGIVRDSAPAAALNVNPASGTLPLPVTADASGSTDPDPTPIASYSFDFGDGSAVVGPQAGATATHTYSTTGTYTVTATVKDTAGQSSTATAQVTVNAGASDAPPAAALTVSPSSGTAPLALTADASASTDTDATPIASYSFNFGDGSAVVGPQAGATATHTYSTAGTYTTTVTVKDTAGQSSTATAQVTVSPALVRNPSFETDLSGWNTSGSDPNVTIARVAGGHTGNWSAQLTNTGTVAASCLLNDAPNWVTSTTAGNYVASMWARADTGGATLTLRIREYAGSTLVRTSTAQVTLTTSWQQVTLTHTTASPGSTLDLNAYVSKAAPGTGFYADDVAISH
ncbi:MAG: PKD domain-containing protein [Gaiellaceae bacterium]